MARCILILLFSLLSHISVEGEVFDSARNYYIDNDSLYSSGCLYYENEDYEKAYECLLSFFADESWRSSSTFVAKGLRYLSSCYRFGRGCEVNSEKADYWMEQAMQWGDENALKLLFDKDWNTLSDEERRKKLDFCVANIDIWTTEFEYPIIIQYEHSDDWRIRMQKSEINIVNNKETENFEKRLVDILLSMDTMNSQEMYLLAWCYKKGFGSLKIDNEKCLSLLQNATALGHKEATDQLFLAYWSTYHKVEGEELAGKVSDNENIQLLLGFYALCDDNIKKAEEYWKPLADNGNEIAMNNYGMLLSSFSFLSDEGVFYLEKLLELQQIGNSYKHIYPVLAEYYRGKGMKQDLYFIPSEREYINKAIYYYEKIDSLSGAEEYLLASCYANSVEYEKAKSLYRRMLESGEYSTKYGICGLNGIKGLIDANENKYESAYENMFHNCNYCSDNGAEMNLFRWYCWGKYGIENNCSTNGVFKTYYEDFLKGFYKKKTKEYIIKGLEILYK